MDIDKRVLYTIIGCFIILIIVTVVSLTIAFRPTPIVDFNKDQFDLIYDKLDQVESNLIINQNIIQKEIDSLETTYEYLSNDLIKYNNQLSTSITKIKKYKDEIKYNNYSDSSTISIIARLQSN
jgi:peptidoglycan hydrolase CwlO-like protein